MDAGRPVQPAAPRDPSREPPREPWRRRVVRTLLYGRNVDRAAKARARIGLAILVFAVGYSVIATRLVMFAVNSEGHTVRRASTQDAVATARPDILDRNGQILATDVRTPSLFAEPHRIIDVDDAVTHRLLAQRTQRAAGCSSGTCTIVSSMFVSLLILIGCGGAMWAVRQS